MWRTISHSMLTSDDATRGRPAAVRSISTPSKMSMPRRVLVSCSRRCSTRSVGASAMRLKVRASRKIGSMTSPQRVETHTSGGVLLACCTPARGTHSDDRPTQLQLRPDAQREVATRAAGYRCQEIRDWTLNLPLNLALDSPLNAHLRLQCPWNPPDKEVPKQGLAASRPLVRQARREVPMLSCDSRKTFIRCLIV